MANKKKTYKFPKYAPGGEFGNFVKNGALAYGDALGGAVGLSNIVTEDDYSGKSAGTFSKIGDTGGQIAGAVLPYALQAAGVPAPATKAAQGIIGGFNPQDSNAQQVPQQSQGMDPNKIAGMAQTGMQIYNMGSQMGAFRNGGIQYAQGGINAEVEMQENSVAPDGEFTQYNGPAHSQGGIKTHLDGGEKVFSDRLKMNGKTFADLNKAYNTKKEDKILEDSKTNPIQRLTAELMKGVKVRNSDKLFNEQEALKQSKLDKYAKRIGLSLDGKYPKGGMTPQQWDKQNIDRGWQVDPRQDYSKTTGTSVYKQYVDPAYKFTPDSTANSKWNIQGPNIDAFGTIPGNAVSTYQAPVNKIAIDTPVPPQYILQGQTTYQGKPAGYFRQGSPAPGTENDRFVFAGGQYVKMTKGGRMPLYFNGGYGPNIEPDNLPMSNTPMMDDANGGSPNWAGIATQIGLGLANNVGNIYDLSRANKVENTKFDRMTPSNLDPTAALNYNMVQGRKLNEDIRNASGGNASNYIQNRKDAAINQMMSNAQIRQSYANQNAGINNQAGMFNTGIANQEVVANEQNRAASRNLKSQAYSNIGQNIMGQYGDYKKGEMDQQKINMLGQYYSDPNFQKMVEEYKRTNRFK